MFQSLEQRVEEEICNGLVSDVCFGAGLNEETRLFCNKSALALASPVFQRMLFAPQWAPADVLDGEHANRITSRGTSSSNGRLLVSCDVSKDSMDGAAPTRAGVFKPGQQIYVAVTDIEPEALRCVLRYVHHLDPQLTLENALHVYRAADKYHIDGLLSACIMFLDSHTDSKNVDQVLRLFDISCRLGLDSYASRFLDYLGELSRLQTARILGSDDFLALHVVSLKKMLSYEGLCVSEEPLWLALRRWAEVQVQELFLVDGRKENESKLEIDCATSGLAAHDICDEDEVPGAKDVPSASVTEDSQQIPGKECQEMAVAAPRPWQSALQPLKHLIRFPTMGSSFFALEVAQTGVLESEEVVEIFCKLANKWSCFGGLAASPRATWGTTNRTSSLESSTRPISKKRTVASFSTEPRAPQIGWCATPGPAGSGAAIMIDEDQGSFGGLFGCTKMGAETSVTVADGRAWSTRPWGPRIALGGPGSRFHFAFGTCGFSSGRHAWTVFWRPLDSLNCDGRPSRSSRGGAAGIARESDMPNVTSQGSLSGGVGNGGNSPTLTSSGGTAGPSNSVAGFPKANAGALRLPSGAMATTAAGGGASGSSGYANNAGVSASGASSDDPSAHFLDWPTCFVFGVKRDVMERRYVAWDPAEADYEDFNGSIRFAIELDLSDKTITYLADRGERRWTAPLTHEGPIYPVIAASGPHCFHIQYGVHL